MAVWRNRAVWLAVMALGTVPALGQPTVTPGSELERLRQAETRQGQIRAQTSAAAEQLASIIADYEVNGLGEGEDVRLLRTLHGMLGSLTSEQMQQVIVLLQQARTPEGVSVEAAREAYDRQQRIVTELRRVLAEYQRTQSAYALAARARVLMERQQAAMRSAIDLAKVQGDRRGQNADDRTRASLAVQATEQQAIAAELEELLGQVAAAAGGGTDRQQAERFRQGLAMMRERMAQDRMQQAAMDLQQNSLFRAATLQRSGRDSLRALWRQIGPPRDRAQQLSDAALELQQHMELQTAVRQQSTAADAAPAFAAAERRQGDLVDRADMTRTDLDLLLPTAAEEVREAIREMQRARQRLDRSEKTAGEPQEVAHRRLVAARDLVLAELERERDRMARAAQRAADQDRLERTRETLEQVRELREQQEQQAARPPSDASASQQAQQRLQARAEELASQAAPDNAAAARELAESARQMQQASRQMSQNPDDPSAARANQERASQSLRQAEARLAEQQAQLERAMGQLDRIAQAQQRLDEAIRQQAEASQSAADASRQEQAERRDAATEAARQQQAEARTAVEAALPEVRAASAEASEALSRAPEPMQQAEQALGRQSPAEARAEQARAERALAEAQDQLSREVDRIRAELDQPSDDGQQAASAMGEMVRQRDAAEQAQSAMAPESGTPSADAAEPSAEAMAAGSATLQQSEARDGHALPPQSRQAMRAAAEEMRQSAAAARAGEAQQAAASAQRAQELLAQALQAAQDAQQMAAEQSGNPESGMAQGPPPPGGEPGEATDPREWDGRRDAQSGGPRTAEGGSSAFLGLPPRERQALQQSQGDRYPQEYGTMVEQYLRNLSRQGGGGGRR